MGFVLLKKVGPALIHFLQKETEMMQKWMYSM